jgi:hypothetical protein
LRARFFSVAVFTGLTVWSAVAYPWTTPGFAALALAEGLIAVFWVRRAHGHDPRSPVVGFMTLSYIGLAYLVSLLVGKPDGLHFWIVFIVALAIVGPIVLVAPKLLPRRAELPD